VVFDVTIIVCGDVTVVCDVIVFGDIRVVFGRVVRAVCDVTVVCM